MCIRDRALTVTVNRGPEFVAVPADLTNVTVDQARATLEAANLRVGFVSEKYNELVVAGTVQSVPSGFEQIPRNSAVDLVVSLGPRPRTVPADAVGRPFDEVAAELGDLSLEVIRVDEPTLDQAEGTVTRLEPCLLYTSDAADDLLCVNLGGRRLIKKKHKKNTTPQS